MTDIKFTVRLLLSVSLYHQGKELSNSFVSQSRFTPTLSLHLHILDHHVVPGKDSSCQRAQRFHSSVNISNDFPDLPPTGDLSQCSGLEPQVSGCCKSCPSCSSESKHRSLGSVPEWLTQAWRSLLPKGSPGWFWCIPKREMLSSVERHKSTEPSGDYIGQTISVK